MYPAFNIGSFVLPTAALIYLLGAWVSLGGVERAARELHLDGEKMYAAALTGLAAGLIGARLTFVAIYWSAFRHNLLGIVWPINSGYNLWGGLLVGAAGVFFYGRANQLKPGNLLDSLAPGLILAFIFISLADFLAGPGFGTLTRVPWAITQFSMRRHPVQVYEILLGVGVLIAWWQTRKFRAFPGQLFTTVAILYSAGRLFLDAFRANAWLTSGGFHILQIISLAVMIGGLILLGQISFSGKEA